MPKLLNLWTNITTTAQTTNRNNNDDDDDSSRLALQYAAMKTA